MYKKIQKLQCTLYSNNRRRGVKATLLKTRFLKTEKKAFLKSVILKLSRKFMQQT